MSIFICHVQEVVVEIVYNVYHCVFVVNIKSEVHQTFRLAHKCDYNVNINQHPIELCSILVCRYVTLNVPFE